MIPALAQRVTSGLLLGGAAIAIFFWAPVPALFGIMLLVAAFATREFYALLPAANIPRYPVVGTLCGLLYLVAVWAQLTCPALTSTQRAAIEPAMFFLIVTAIFLRQFPQTENPRPLETMAGTLMGVLYVPLMLSFYPRLLLTWGEGTGRWLIFYGVLVVKVSDIGAYFAGSLLGRHKLCPHISPKKTWEGLAGGIAASLVVSLLWWHWAHGRIGALELTLPHAVSLGLLLPVMGLFGDLAESVFKRAANVKDSASYIQGMGGILDVLDSLLLTAPLLFLYVLLFLHLKPGV